MRNVSDKGCRENHSTFCVQTFSENHALYKIMKKNMGEMRFTCWITKAADTHSECVVLISFPRQQLLEECASMLCFKYTASWFM